MASAGKATKRSTADAAESLSVRLGQIGSFLSDECSVSGLSTQRSEGGFKALLYGDSVE